MSIIDKATAQAAAVVIRDEDTEGANTAARVGGLLKDIADSVPFPQGVLTAAGLSGAYNNYNVSPIQTAYALRFGTDTEANFSGIAQQGPGAVRLVLNIGTTGTINLLHESSLSDAANRFKLPGAKDVALTPGASVILWYDANAARWTIANLEVQDVPTLASVLARGNDTNGHDIILRDSVIRGAEGGEIEGGDVHLVGGEAFDAAGGNIILTPGTGTTSGLIKFEGDVDGNGYLISNILDPIDPQDAATKAYVDASGGGGGGTPTLAQVLVAGRVTGGESITVSSGDAVKGQDGKGTNADGFNLDLVGGAPTGSGTGGKVNVNSAFLVGMGGNQEFFAGSHLEMAGTDSRAPSQLRRDAGTLVIETGDADVGSGFDGVSLRLKPGNGDGKGGRGWIDTDGARLGNLPEPTLSQDAATKNYVDTAVAGGGGGGGDLGTVLTAGNRTDGQDIIISDGSAIAADAAMSNLSIGYENPTSGTGGTTTIAAQDGDTGGGALYLYAGGAGVDGDGGNVVIVPGALAGDGAAGTIVLQGEISANNHKIQDVTDPTNAQDAATKAYVDAHSGGGGAPTTAEYLVGKSDGGLSAERVVTDTTSITWDLATGGQAKAKRAALTGDVTASADSNATTIANDAVTTAKILNDAVTYAKLQNVSATDRLLGRDTAAAGDVEELTVGGGVEFTGSGGIQRSALTGDVTASAGSNTTAIATDAVTTSKILNGNVTLAKMANIATDSLIGRDTASSGVPEVISVGGGVEFTGSGGIQRSALTGDVTASAGSGTTAIASNAVTDAKLRDSSACSVIGRSANTSGDPADIAASADGNVLRRASGALGWGTIATAGIGDAQVTLAKLADLATDRLMGRDTAGTGVPESLTVGGGVEFTGSGGIQRSALTGDVTATAGSNSTTIANDAVTYAKLQNISATDRLLGRDTAAAGDCEELTVSGGVEFTGSGGIQRSALTGDVTASAGSNATTIANSAVSNAKLANVATATIKGRVSASTGAVEDLTGTQCTTLLDVFTSGLKGLVPASGGGSTFLRADASFAAPTSGQVTNASGVTGTTVTDALDTLNLLDVQTFSKAGTWNTVAGAKWHLVDVCAGGGSGGGGVGAAAATTRQGGTGGGGGARVQRWIPATAAGKSQSVTVGGATTGGAGGSSADGTAGTAGGASSFGTLVSAQGGGAGGFGSTATNRSGGGGGGLYGAGNPGGTAAAQGGRPSFVGGDGIGGGGATGAAGAVGFAAEWGGGAGGGVSSTGLATDGGSSICGGAGGGAGGRVSAANSAGGGNAGGNTGAAAAASGGGGAGGGVATNGTNGGAGTLGVSAGQGGGGGGGNNAGTAANGGDGGIPGGGGGGGGGGTTVGGNGGAGARGEVTVWTYG